MKKNVHPDTRCITITCLCGNRAELISTKSALYTETCSRCHPFFTGMKRAATQSGRIARFLNKYKSK